MNQATRNKIKDITAQILKAEAEVKKSLANPVFDSIGRRKTWHACRGELSISRFSKRILVNKISGCWDWVGVLKTGGYGAFTPGRSSSIKANSSHRFIYQYVYGIIPDHLEVDHECRNRACANPEHLRLMTHANNQKRIRKEFCHRGHPQTNKNVAIYGRLRKRVCRKCNAINVNDYQKQRPANDPDYREKLGEQRRQINVRKNIKRKAVRAASKLALISA